MNNPSIRDAFNLQNELRVKHHVKELTWSPECAKMATAWAEHIASTGQFAHGGYIDANNKRYGQNLYMCRGTSKTAPIDAVKQWYRESEQYEYKVVSPPLSKGHFTQMVWKGTQSCGIGVAYGSTTIVCCMYDPPGNVKNTYINNVLPPTTG